MTKRAVLLANLGSPDNAQTPAVRSYLNQFLMDRYVIQLPWVFRRLLVSLFVLPTRPKASADAYQKIWLAEGSPLIFLSEKLRLALQSQLSIPVALAMRYGKPSIESELLKLSEKNIDEVLFIPLYPHFADSTVTTSIEEAKRVIKQHQLAMTLSIVPPFYDNKDYIQSLGNSAQPYLSQDYDHIVFSYHGLPESHIIKLDESANHCLQQSDCSQRAHACHTHCYRHQVFQTTQQFADQAGLLPQQYSIAFQSRLGREKWLGPNTEDRLRELANNGVKNILVICPAFVTDCLETLEEFAISGQDVFTEAGGESLTLIPCLNAHPDWVATLASWCPQ